MHRHCQDLGKGISKRRTGQVDLKVSKKALEEILTNYER